ncbi:PREDICTED: uncharacterized protein LOC108507497 [Lepidothrix coronata]|uniref:Uncharacterized protein LOC108507497 n=1 Tax=Lepidothrix coronata TaxID=321398 RepID=A0A6J0IWF4_9PASS|nr:PREDICTED: uncharacterized protein LOC108507497 [Lepidothrix coronata]
MKRQAVYSLFSEFLQKKGVKYLYLKKELPGLLEYGNEKGCFVNPHTVHSVEEWCKFGDKIWEALLDEDKVAKKLGKLWRVVYNTLLQHEAERQAAEQALNMRQQNKEYKNFDWFSYKPSPPAMQTVHLPAVPPDLSKINTDGLLESKTPAAPTAPPPLADTPSGQTDPEPTPPPPAHSTKEPVPGAFSDSVEAVVKERRETWAAFAKHCLEQGDSHGLQVVDSYAFPVTYNQDGQGGITAAIIPLDWKFLAQLRSTVNEFGLHSEPTKQMLDYFWCTYLLLPSDLRSITRMILTEHQQLLFNAYWQVLVNESVAELLEKALVLPTGENAFLVNAIQDLAKGLKEQAQSSQAQVPAALAPLQVKAHNFAEEKARSKCYR